MKRSFAIALAVSALSAGALQAQITVDLTTSNGGFTTASAIGISNPWSWSAGTGWSVDGISSVSLQNLLSPVFAATGTSFGLAFDNVRNFEPTFDGGQILYSVNGGAFNLFGVLGDPYTNISGNAFGSPLPGQLIMSGAGSGTIALSGAANVGDTYQFMFRAAFDVSVSGGTPAWNISSVTYRGFDAADVPEPSSLALTFLGLSGFAVAARRRRATR